MNIVAGPFLGEFGWELMMWQGIFRKKKMLYPSHKLVIFGKRGHEALYECDEFIPYDYDDGETDAWKLNGVEPLLTKEILAEFPGYEYISPKYCFLGMNQVFKRYGNRGEVSIDNSIIIHARSTRKCGTEYRNWDLDKWDNLCSKLKHYNIIAIGSPKDSYCPPMATDCRGISLEALIALMSKTQLVVGPSSGPMHLASLCGTPHIVWTDQTYWDSCGGTNRDRYERVWNPLNTKVVVIDDEGWQPSVDTVYNKITEIISGKNK